MYCLNYLHTDLLCIQFYRLLYFDILINELEVLHIHRKQLASAMKNKVDNGQSLSYYWEIGKSIKANLDHVNHLS